MVARRRHSTLHHPAITEHSLRGQSLFSKDSPHPHTHSITHCHKVLLLLSPFSPRTQGYSRTADAEPRTQNTAHSTTQGHLPQRYKHSHSYNYIHTTPGIKVIEHTTHYRTTGYHFHNHKIPEHITSHMFAQQQSDIHLGDR